MKTHPIADIFPMMTGAAFDALCADIKAKGVRVPIVVHPDGRILDGRNRQRACDALGVVAPQETWAGAAGTEVSYVLSLNLARRHLDESQRAMVAARLATLGEGRPKVTASIEAITQPDAAGLLNVSRPSVQRARSVLATGTPDLIAAVDDGAIPVSQGSTLAKASIEKQARVVTRVKAGAKPAQAMREERAAEMKRRARDRRRKVFGLLVIDDDEEAPSDEEDLLAWSASLDFDSFQRTLVT